MDLQLDDKRVLVNGSGSGIGKATANAFLDEGAKVIGHGMTQVEVDAYVADLSPLGEVVGMAADPANISDATSLCEFALKEGGIDVLFNNVGIAPVNEFANLTDEDRLNFYNVNILSAVRMSRVLLPTTLDHGTGSIVNPAGEAGVKPFPQMVHHSVNNTAMLGLSSGMVELTKGTEVLVNSALPGSTWTEGVKAYFDGVAQQKGEPLLEETIYNYFNIDEPTTLIQRFAQADEVARTILSVASNKAANDAAFRVEGGNICSIS